MANMAIQPVELNCELRLGKFRSYGDAQHEAKVVFVENYILISWFLAILGVEVLGKKLV